MSEIENMIWEAFFLLTEEIDKHNDGETKASDLVFSVKARQIISDIAEISRKTELFRCVQARAEQFQRDVEGETPGAMYAHMAKRAAEAPTPLLAISIIILLMPMLDEMLNHGGENAGMVVTDIRSRKERTEK